MRLHPVTLGEFERIASTGVLDDYIAQESPTKPSKFNLIGFNTAQGTGYIVRHGREKKPRDWRLDVLIEQLRKFGCKDLGVTLRHSAPQATQ